MEAPYPSPPRPHPIPSTDALSQYLRLAAREVPSDRILVETDTPYLAPQAVRGKRNEPAYVVHTLAALAQARNEDAAELGRQIDRNADRCFGLT